MNSMDTVCNLWPGLTDPYPTDWGFGFNLGIIYGSVLVAYNQDEIDFDEKRLLLDIASQLSEETRHDNQ